MKHIKLLHIILLLLSLIGTAVKAEMTLQLKQGWNLISFPQQPSQNVLQQLTENDAIQHVWTLPANSTSNRQWQRAPIFYKGQPTFNTVSIHKAYWIQSNAAINLSIQAAESTSSVPLVLKKGWNFIGFNVNEAVDYQDFLSLIEFNQLWRFNAQTQSYQAIISGEGATPITKEFNNIEPYVGYWMHVDSEQELGAVLSTIAPADQDVSPYAQGQYGTRIPWNLSLNDKDLGDDGYFDNSYTQRAFDLGDETNTQYLVIRNLGSGALNYTLSIADAANTPWLSLSEETDDGNSTATAITGKVLNTPKRVAIHVDRTGFAPNSVHKGKLILSSDAKNDSQREFNVSMRVTDITGDYQIQVKLESISHQGVVKQADLYNPKYALTMVRDNKTGELRSRMNQSRNLLLPADYVLVGNTVNNAQHNFTISGSLALPKEAFQFNSDSGTPIIRNINFTGRRAASIDNLSDTALLGQYEEVIYGMLAEPIKFKGTFTAYRNSRKIENFLVNATQPNEYTSQTIVFSEDGELKTHYEFHKNITERLVISNARVQIGIDHDTPEQLSIALRDPQGNVHRLRSKGERGGVEFLDYEKTNQSIDTLAELINHYTNGTWTLQITDHLNDVFTPTLNQYNLILTGNRVYNLTIQFPSHLPAGTVVMLNGCGVSYFATVSNNQVAFQDLSECYYQVVILDPIYQQSYPVALSGEDLHVNFSTTTSSSDNNTITPNYQTKLDFHYLPRVGLTPQNIQLTALSELPTGHQFEFQLYQQTSSVTFSLIQSSLSTNNYSALTVSRPGIYALSLRQLDDQGTEVARIDKHHQPLIFGRGQQDAHVLTSYQLGAGSAGIIRSNTGSHIKDQYAYDSATFDIDRLPFITASSSNAGVEDSDGFKGDISPVSGTNQSNTTIVDGSYVRVPDGRIHSPTGDLRRHYRIKVSIGQPISGFSVDRDYRLTNSVLHSIE